MTFEDSEQTELSGGKSQPQSIKEKILSQDEKAQIIRKRSLLDPNEIVDEERIVGRDEQLDALTQSLRVVINDEKPPNLFMYGPSGTGKSLIAKAVCENIVELCQSRDISLGVMTINCQNINTLDDAVYSLCRRVAIDAGTTVEVPENGVSTTKKWRELYRLLNENYDIAIFVLDELDMLVGRRARDVPAYSDVLYQLSRADNDDQVDTKVSVTVLTNDTKMLDDVGSRAISSYSPTEIHFNDYDANQLRKILENRQDAFYEGSLTDDAIPLTAAFAAQTHGDARKAIDLIRTAGKNAEQEGVDQVTEDHVRDAQDEVEKNRVLEVTRGISAQKKYCLFATAVVADVTDEQRAKSPNGHTVYEYVTDTLGAETFLQETFVNNIKELTTYSLVETEQKSDGPQTGRYLDISFEERPETIIETLREESADLDEISRAELESVVTAVVQRNGA
jgi:cell division control protein 6